MYEVSWTSFFSKVFKTTLQLDPLLIILGTSGSTENLQKVQRCLLSYGLLWEKTCSPPLERNKDTHFQSMVNGTDWYITPWKDSLLSYWKVEWLQKDVATNDLFLETGCRTILVALGGWDGVDQGGNHYLLISIYKCIYLTIFVCIYVFFFLSFFFFLICFLIYRAPLILMSQNNEALHKPRMDVFLIFCLLHNKNIWNTAPQPASSPPFWISTWNL